MLNDLTGIEWVETERDGVIIGSGDTVAYNPTQPLLVFDINLDDRFNGGWFRSALGGITGYLGLGYALTANYNDILIPPSVHELPGLSVGDIDTNRAIPGYEVRSSDTDLDFDQHAGADGPQRQRLAAPAAPVFPGEQRHRHVPV